MTLDQYFALPDTPMANSPVGNLMKSMINSWGLKTYCLEALEIVRDMAQDRLYGFSKRSKRLAIPLPGETLRG